jgi:hypothetical protein
VVARASVDMPLAAPRITTMGASVDRRAANASWIRARAWAKKITAVMVARPRYRVSGANTMRAGSCIAPIQPIIDAARVGE